MQGGTQLAQAVIAGSIPIAVMGGAYLSAAVRGADLVMIATHMDKLPYTLIVKPNLKRVEDLKGSRLAISRFGSSSDAGLRLALQKLGVQKRRSRLSKSADKPSALLRSRPVPWTARWSYRP
jgi:NitT/TauT family transport system substrate-binding protein